MKSTHDVTRESFLHSFILAVSALQYFNLGLTDKQTSQESAIQSSSDTKLCTHYDTPNTHVTEQLAGS